MTDHSDTKKSLTTRRMVIMLIIVGAFTLVYLRVTQKQAVYGDKSTAI